MRTKFTLLSLLALIAVLLSACAAGGSANQTQPQPRTLTVDGQAVTYATPDVAYISIGVHTEDPNAGTAVANNNAQAQKVIAALTAKGIDPKDLRTTNFSIYPQDQFDQNGQKTGTHFIVDNTVYVTLRAIDKIGDVLSSAVEAGANSITGIQFDVLDKTQLLNDARNKAIENAKAQAGDVAKAAGVTLGNINNISFYSNVPPVPMLDSKVAAGVGGGGSTPISTGQLTFSVNATLTFEIK